MKKSADRKSLFLGWEGRGYEFRTNCRMKTIRWTYYFLALESAKFISGKYINWSVKFLPQFCHRVLEYWKSQQQTAHLQRKCRWLSCTVLLSIYCVYIANLSSRASQYYCLLCHQFIIIIIIIIILIILIIIIIIITTPNPNSQNQHHYHHNPG